MAEIQLMNYGDVLEQYAAFGTFPSGFSLPNYKKTIREMIQEISAQHPMDMRGLYGDRTSFKREQRHWVIGILNQTAKRLGFTESISIMKITAAELYKPMATLLVKASDECSLSVRDVIDDLAEPLVLQSTIEYENISFETDK